MSIHTGTIEHGLLCDRRGLSTLLKPQMITPIK